MTAKPTIRRPGARAATGLALAATLLTTAGATAQGSTATTAPEATAAPAQTSDRPGMGGRRGIDQPGWGFGAPGRGDRTFDGRGAGGWGHGLRGDPGARQGVGVTVASIDGASLGLVTQDGWSRTIDTTGVALTRDGATITPTDILVGERVRVVQTRNADGTYTVTGIEVQPAIAIGTVGTVSADGFTVVGSDGTTTTITVTAETTWSARGSASVTIADATAGRSVAAEGQLQADGSIVASRVRLG